MQVVVESKVFKKFPGFLVGLIEVKGINNKEQSYRIQELLKNVSLALQTTMQPEKVATHDLLSAWEAVQKMTGKQTHYKSSLELLLRRVIRGDKIRPLNKLVDLARYASLKHLVPINVFDTAFLQDLHYGLASHRDHVDGSFMGKPTAGALVLKDRIGVVANWFGHRQSKKTHVNTHSRNILIRIEVLNPPVPKIRLEFIMNDVVDLVQTFCGGALQKAILSSEKRSVEF